MLGIREPEIYGSNTYEDLCDLINAYAKEKRIAVEIFQSNHEGELVDEIQDAYSEFDAIIINPAAYTHTSIALLDALKSVGIPAGEVHSSDVSKREDYRQISYVREYCFATVTGLGFHGYLKAIDLILERENDG